MSFPRYPSYKDSGVEWLGQVPAHWEVAPPKWHVRSAAGGTSIKGSCADEPAEGLFPGFSASGQDVWLEAPDFDGPGIVLSAVGARCGKTFKANGAWGVVANTHCLFPIHGTDCDYLWYLTNREDWWEKGGSAQPFVKVSDTLARKWVFPSPAEQTAIAAFLDRETGKIDELVAEQRRLMELLKEKRQAVISHAVTRGLNPAAPLKPSGIEWLGDVPAHWEVSKMKWVARMESGHTPDKKIPAYWENGDIPWVSLNDTGFLKDNDYISETAHSITEAGIANSSAHLLPPRAVVFSRDATIGRCAITTRPMAVSQHFIAWVCGETMIPEFLLMRLRSMTRELDRLTTGATVKTIGMPEVRTLVTPVPPVEEQKEIIAWVSSEVERIDTLTAEAQRAIDLLQERRTALISAAVTGQIDVRPLGEKKAA